MTPLASTAVARPRAGEQDGPDAQSPVFIGGLAHSGKTPLRLALSAGCDIALSRRTYMWNRFYNQYGDLALPHNFERCLAAMLRRRAIRELCDDARVIRQTFWKGAPTYGRLFAIFHEQHARRAGKRRWGDQLGFVERYADAIFEAYPQAHMIHMIRDPREVCLITMQHSKFRSGKLGWSLAGWLQSARLTRRNQERYPEKYRVVQYEILMAQPEETLRALSAFLGEPYNAAMVGALIAAGQSKRLDKNVTASQKAGTQDRRRLSGRQLTFAQAYARRQLQTFGYELQQASLTWRDRVLFALVDWPANRAAMLLRTKWSQE